MKVIQRKRKGQRPGQRLAETIRREVAVMKKLRHPNIVTLWEVIDDPRAQQLYMIQVRVSCLYIRPFSLPLVYNLFLSCVRLQRRCRWHYWILQVLSGSEA